MEEKLDKIQKDSLAKIQLATSLKEIDDIFLEFFGKNGQLTLLPGEFSKLSREELHKVGSLFNKAKLELEKAISDKRQAIREDSYKKLTSETLSLQGDALEARKSQKRTGHLHPLTQFEKKITDLFGKLGFQQYDAPHIDTDFNTYGALNIPEDSPARDLQDTLYIDPKNFKIPTEKLLLRGHTSNSEIRIMREFKPPIRIMLIGRCFRYENLDARHEHTFDQFEIVYIDKGVNMGNLQYLSEYFLKSVFGTEIRARMRTKYYPQVEPGAGIDGLCIFCKGKGCKVCGGVGWLELGGAGMIHPVALKNGGVDPSVYSGLAWGISPERMVMLIEGIVDIRLFRSGDLKFLQKY